MLIACEVAVTMMTDAPTLSYNKNGNDDDYDTFGDFASAVPSLEPSQAPEGGNYLSVTVRSLSSLSSCGRLSFSFEETTDGQATNELCVR